MSANATSFKPGNPGGPGNRKRAPVGNLSLLIECDDVEEQGLSEIEYQETSIVSASYGNQAIFTQSSAQAQENK